MTVVEPCAVVPSRPPQFRTARVCGMAGLLLGFAVLAGWAWDSGALKTVLPDLVAMQPWAALVAGGLALIAASLRTPGATAVRLIAAFSLLAIAGENLLAYAGLDLGSDAWLFTAAVLDQPGRAYPGRLAALAAVAMICLAAVLLLASDRRRWSSSLFSLITSVGLFIIAVPLVGYLFGLSAARLATPIALHTAIGLLVLFVGAITLRPDAGWLASLTGSRPGSRTARLLLPMVVVGPVLVAYLFEAGRRAGLYDTDFRLALTTVTTVAFLAVSVVWSLRRVDQLRDAQSAAAEAARASEARYRILFEQAAVGIVQLSLDGWILRANAKLCQMLGYASAELVGRNFRDVTHPGDLGTDEHLLNLLVRGDIASIDREKRYLRKDGTPLWVRVESSIARDGPFTVPYRISVVVDISARKQAEEALFQEKERAEVTLHCIGDAVMTTDTSARVIYLNPVAERLTGWSMEEAKGQPLDTVFRIIDEETRKPVPDPVQRCLREGRVTGLPEHTVLISRFGDEHAIDDSAARIHDRGGEVLGAVLVFHDVSETRRLSRQLKHDAAHDALTGLVNRREFERRLERAVASAKRHGLEHALCYFDLDEFKLVSDTAGHAAGDALLKQVKGLLAGKFRDRDTLARLGGDEFALLLDNCRLEEACRIAEMIVATFCEWRFAWKSRTFQVGASAGVAAISRGSESAAQALSQADVACYTAKEHGRNRVHVYRGDGVRPSSHHARMMLAATLNDALNENRFRLFGQPIVPLAAEAGEPVRHEVLLRLLDDQGAIILPGTFIPAAERYGMMARVDRWVIDNALRSYAAMGELRTGMELSVNLSADSLRSDDLAAYVLAAFRANGIRPETICFEVTETAAIRNIDNALAFINEMRRHGCRIALDDFGSGQSSFHYLRSLPADYLKIDGCFVRTINKDEQNEAVVAAINGVAHKLGIATIAEYVEDLAIAECLRRIGVDYAQGYAFGMPAPLERVLLAAAA